MSATRADRAAVATRPRGVNRAALADVLAPGVLPAGHMLSTGQMLAAAQMLPAQVRATTHARRAAEVCASAAHAHAAEAAAA
ncbi:MAG: hypothetical protein JO228_00745, partial [Xanthobacteraceae bacterium]|nr:hypothetical protein [Xanthobacteraceae bacterium]